VMKCFPTAFRRDFLDLFAIEDLGWVLPRKPFL
jgi:hypothetical protein